MLSNLFSNLFNVSTCILLTLQFIPQLCQAQIVSDNTVSTTVVTNDSNNFKIIGGQRVGENLFHSFEQFSVSNNGSIHFDNPEAITNIFSRVTGDSPSSIDGLIRANGNASLFLLNPRGIYFSENASIEIGGSFLVSTASTLLFADGTQFSTIDPQVSPLLTVSVPVGLQFAENPAPIDYRTPYRDRYFNPFGNFVNFDDGFPISGLVVQPQNTLAVIGGDVTLIGGRLAATEGRIEVGSIQGTGIVGLEAIPEGWQLNYEQISTFGDIHFTQGSGIRASAEQPNQVSSDIHLQGHQIIIEDGSYLSALNRGPRAGGDITLIASERVDIRCDCPPTVNGVGIRQQIGLLNIAFNEGRSGNIFIETGDFLLQGHPLGADINANFRIDDTAVIVSSAGLDFGVPAIGRGGDITVIAQNHSMLTGGSFISSETSLTEPGGVIIFEARTLRITDGATIAASNFGSGRGGAIVLDVLDTIEISGVNPNLPISMTDPTLGRSSSLSTNTGIDPNLPPSAGAPAGRIDIQTEKLMLTDGAVLSASTRREAIGGDIILNLDILNLGNGAQILTRASEVGNAGDIQISALNQVSLTGQNSGIFADTTSQSTGSGGNIFISAPELMISDNAQISVSSQGAGLAGELEILSPFVTLNQGILTADTVLADGGNIILNISKLLALRNNSKISTSGGLSQTSGNGGDITINSNLIVAFPRENSDISTDAFSGNGGTIEITAQGIFGLQFRSTPTELSDITANSQIGFDGIVNLEVPEVDPSDSLNKLPSMPVVVNPLDSRCQQTTSGSNGRFILANRGGIADRPSIPQVSLSTHNHLVSPIPTQTAYRNSVIFPSKKLNSQAIIEAQGWLKNANNLVVLVSTSNQVFPQKILDKEISCRRNILNF